MIIGGTDSSGGAGLTRDAAVAQKYGCKAMPIVTAVTAQSDHSVIDTTLMPTRLILQQISAALATAPPATIKISMLGDQDIATAVAEALCRLTCPIVLDPVLRSSSGAALLSGALPPDLLSQVTLLTPNLPEAALLTGTDVATSEAAISAQARSLLAKGPRAVLIKGGHGTGDRANDYLFSANGRHVLQAPRLRNVTLRGTGCALATAIACGLARGHDLHQACSIAKDAVFDMLCAHQPAMAGAPYSGAFIFRLDR